MDPLAITELTLIELKRLQRDVEQAMASYKYRKKLEAYAVLNDKARELGFTLSELPEPAEPQK